MNADKLRLHLKSIIENNLTPLINSDYVYWDLPYHINIGDTLIWQGTLDYLSQLNYKMLDFGSYGTISFPEIDKNVVILMHGGGNFGDIYSTSQDLRKDVIEKYKGNRIIILPQTIHFYDKEKEKEDLLYFSKHENLFLCVRDKLSYEIAIRYLDKSKVLLLPDMAFCIKPERLVCQKENTTKSLLMRRIDVEAKKVDDTLYKLTDVHSDWPTFEKIPYSMLTIMRLCNISKKTTKSKKGNKTFLSKIIDKIAITYMKDNLFKQGVEFIGEYDTIYTTRLHGCILALLLNKKVILLDNSYGKNMGFYNAWLTECSNIVEVKSVN
ncbi:polysaccharide pyruvyl transferase family protein [Acinetobacter pittii]|uniref:polysaccharide pyruvyl transferase family protein n=1 Tax=Acinetobacter pittii TaxID=48296 RepID=UPI00300CA1C3